MIIGVDHPDHPVNELLRDPIGYHERMLAKKQAESQQPSPLRCEWPNTTCPEPVVAKIGLPRESALWVCEKHFNEWNSKGAGP